MRIRGENHTTEVKMDEDDAIDIAEASSSSSAAADEYKPNRRGERFNRNYINVLQLNI